MSDELSPIEQLHNAYHAQMKRMGQGDIEITSELIGAVQRVLRKIDYAEPDPAPPAMLSRVFDIAAQGIQDLIAQAASDDLETAFLARQQLAQQLASFAQLAQAGLLEGSVPFLDALADQLEALGLGRPGAAE